MDDPIRTIRGLVIPCQWDEAGNITAVAIASQDEREYRMEAESESLCLMDYLHKLVEVKGRIRGNRMEGPGIRTYGGTTEKDPVFGAGGRNYARNGKKASASRIVADKEKDGSILIAEHIELIG